MRVIILGADGSHCLTLRCLALRCLALRPFASSRDDGLLLYLVDCRH